MIDEKQVKKYCIEDVSLIENYDKAINDTEQTWDCHHRLEIQDGKVMTVDALKKAGLYYNRPASELIFLSHNEHTQLHKKGENHPFYGKHHSEEAKHKISKAKKGENNSMYGKHLSVETKKKISKANKGKKNPMYNKHHSEEAKQKMSEAKKGKHLSEEHKQKIKNYWDKRRQQKLFTDIQDAPE